MEQSVLIDTVMTEANMCECCLNRKLESLEKKVKEDMEKLVKQQSDTQAEIDQLNSNIFDDELETRESFKNFLLSEFTNVYEQLRDMKMTLMKLKYEDKKDRAEQKKRLEIEDEYNTETLTENLNKMLTL